ncbi:MAG TPA: 4-aminobutyrate--2-oxoglutarate transaminase [Actinomycetota bacterium]|nr:4-aminobutyrate--2-oxoglutarate transaminase [Actinomycetota bacterium]
MEIPQERLLVTEVPGPRSRELAERRASAVPAAVYTTAPIGVRRAENSIVEDVDGNRLIDLAAGLAVLNVGSAAPEVLEAIRTQAELATHTCFHVTMNEPYIELAERLNALTPGDHDKRTLLVNSGAEAVENAVKIARRATGRPGVVTFDHAFHGRTLLAMSLTGKASPYKDGFGPFAPEVYRVPYSYPFRCSTGAGYADCGSACATAAIDRIERSIGAHNVACAIVEPILGEGGFVVPGDGFLPELAAFCKERGIVFIADEVQTGLGRTGRWFGIEHEELVPDIVTTAKALGGGLPIAAVTGRDELMDAIHRGGLGGTFGGNPVAAAAALAVIDKIEREGLVARAEAIGGIVREALERIQRQVPAVGDIRGRGAMQAFELVEPGTRTPTPALTSAILSEALSSGVIVLKAGSYDNVVRLLPPLTIDDGLLEDGLAVLEKAVITAAA